LFLPQKKCFYGSFFSFPSWLLLLSLHQKGVGELLLEVKMNSPSPWSPPLPFGLLGLFEPEGNWSLPKRKVEKEEAVSFQNSNG
jgi:hypothetical protein